MKLKLPEEDKKVRTNLFIKGGVLHKIDYITSLSYVKKGAKDSRSDIVNEALEKFVAEYEKQNKITIPPKP